MKTITDFSENDPISSRYLCDIILDIRKCWKTRNFSYINGLIEELQYRANRMESRLDLIGSVERLEANRINLKKEIEDLRKEKQSLQKELGKEVESKSRYL